MALANGFLSREEFAAEYFFSLAFGFCESCSMAQLLETVPPEKMFHPEYPFVTASSRRMVEHFERFAREVADNWSLRDDSFVVELGSNDGTLLRCMAKRGIGHLGIEPSSNVAAIAENKGIRTLRRFFSEETARDILREYGPADVVLAANCVCHIQDLHSLAAGIRTLLKPRGIFIFEDPYIGDVIERVAYDQIYDEHAFYFSAGSVRNWLSGHGLEIIDVERQETHGGSMRYTVGRRGAFSVGARVLLLEENEKQRGLHRLEPYREFAAHVRSSGNQLVSLLQRLKHDGRRVVGYGATSKSTTVLNYCSIGPALVEFISDTTPLKQGKFSPGVHIPVRPYEEFPAHYPDYALLFAWNHADEIMSKEREFLQAGGRWIRYVPRVEVSP